MQHLEVAFEHLYLVKEGDDLVSLHHHHLILVGLLCTGGRTDELKRDYLLEGGEGNNIAIPADQLECFLREKSVLPIGLKFQAS